MELLVNYSEAGQQSGGNPVALPMEINRDGGRMVSAAAARQRKDLARFKRAGMSTKPNCDRLRADIVQGFVIRVRRVALDAKADRIAATRTFETHRHSNLLRTM